MSKHNMLSVDLAKNLFQIARFNSRNQVVMNKSLKREKFMEFLCKESPTLIVMEACYSSHYWGRVAESYGHQVMLLPAQHVTPFVRGNKSDRNDTVAIGEAANRPHIRPVPLKSVGQQDIQCLHRMRERYVRTRTGLINQTRGLLSEYGVIAPQGHKAFCALLREICQPVNKEISPLLKEQLNQVADEYYHLSDRLADINGALKKVVKDNVLCRILMTIPGIGVINATAIFSAIGNGSQFRNARELAVWLGLTPRQSSSGEKFTSGGITKRGNRYLRKQLIHGARALLSRCKRKTDRLSQWANQLVARRGFNKASVALASRLARLCWVLLQREESYKAMP